MTWPLSAGTCAVLIADLAVARAPLLSGVLIVCLFGGASAAFFSVALIGTFLFIRGLERPERKALILPVLLIAAGLIPTVLGAAFFSLLG